MTILAPIAAVTGAALKHPWFDREPQLQRMSL